MKILFAEDNILTRNLYSKALLLGKHDVDTAENGLIALEKLQANKYDAVIMDLMMPKKSGLDIITEIVKSKLSHDFNKWVVFSNITDHTLVEQVKSKGITRFIDKEDCEPNQLLKYVNDNFVL